MECDTHIRHVTMWATVYLTSFLTRGQDCQLAIDGSHLMVCRLSAYLQCKTAHTALHF
jgi:hypothetical protein